MVDAVQEMLRVLPTFIRELVERVNGVRPSKVCPVGGSWPQFFYHLGQEGPDDILLRRDAQSVFLHLLLRSKYEAEVRVPPEWQAILLDFAPLLGRLLQAGIETGRGAQPDGGSLVVPSGHVLMLEKVLIHLLKMSYFNVDPVYGEQAAHGMEVAVEWARCQKKEGTVRTSEEQSLWERKHVVGIERLMYRQFWDDGVQDFGPNPYQYAANMNRLSSSSHPLVRGVPQYAGLDHATGRSRDSEKGTKCLRDEKSPAEKVRREASSDEVNRLPSY
jgi:hypothetical protein